MNPQKKHRFGMVREKKSLKFLVSTGATKINSYKMFVGGSWLNFVSRAFLVLNDYVILTEINVVNYSYMIHAAGTLDYYSVDWLRLKKEKVGKL